MYQPETEFIVSCEHAAAVVPPEFSPLFRGHEKLLGSHRAFDTGAAALAAFLAGELGTVLFLGPITRLLADLNRSPHNHRRLFSEISRNLPQPLKSQLLQAWYYPYRQAVEAAINCGTKHGRTVIHLAVHSFVPELNNHVRNADLGLLYDPCRAAEKEFCLRLAATIQNSLPTLRIRRNYPYRGSTDGFPTFLRKKFSARHYLGIELEINQALLADDRQWHVIRHHLALALKTTARHFG